MDAAATPSSAMPGLLVEALVIGLGGAIGTSLRGAIQALWPSDVSLSPAFGAFALVEPVLVANLLGAAALGAILGGLSGSNTHALTRPFLCIGLLGSFTTWSSLVAETTAIASAENETAALLKLGGSLVLGVAAFGLGERSGRRIGGARS